MLSREAEGGGKKKGEAKQGALIGTLAPAVGLHSLIPFQSKGSSQCLTDAVCVKHCDSAGCFRQLR